MDRLENTASNSSCIVARELVAVETGLFRGRYLVMGLHATVYTTLDNKIGFKEIMCILLASDRV
jgi:hypothetical protein